MDLTQQEWAAQQAANPDSMIIDVRTSEEYSDRHIPNAKLLDIRDPQGFMDGVATLDNSKTYFVYCRSGARSAQACQIFKQQGVSSCFNLLGGIMEWQGETTS
ncbi:MAG: rhodanese-like domain-containing protein [Flavobacteriaceae bacterium]|jgi:rhodanese-related sulfurtransferase|nr:rhodanese-like domain-containing protein [Flavobacteriaceae bacterium]MDG1912807.1 rhodanese-like domain-containing protein [Flavobacteriaceae bacterium]